MLMASSKPHRLSKVLLPSTIPKGIRAQYMHSGGDMSIQTVTPKPMERMSLPDTTAVGAGKINVVHF